MSELVGFDSFILSCDRIVEKLDGKQLAAAVKKGAKLVQKSIQSAAPIDTGELRDGLVIIKEKSQIKGKVAYQITPTRQKNDVYQKPIQNPVRSTAKHAYYPASQEYGYFTRRPGGGMIYVRSDGRQTTVNKVPGKYYMRTGADMVSDRAKDAIAQAVLDMVAREYGG
jgi:hypothetical protein